MREDNDEPILNPKGVDEYVAPKDETATSFQEFHNEMRKYRRRVFVRKDDKPHVPHVNEGRKFRAPDKKTQRMVKRARVAAMKAAGHLKGDNRPVRFVPNEVAK